MSDSMSGGDMDEEHNEENPNDQTNGGQMSGGQTSGGQMSGGQMSEEMMEEENLSDSMLGGNQEGEQQGGFFLEEGGEGGVINIGGTQGGDMQNENVLPLNNVNRPQALSSGGCQHSSFSSSTRLTPQSAAPGLILILSLLGLIRRRSALSR